MSIGKVKYAESAEEASTKAGFSDVMRWRNRYTQVSDGNTGLDNKRHKMVDQRLSKGWLQAVHARCKSLPA